MSGPPGSGTFRFASTAGDEEDDMQDALLVGLDLSQEQWPFADCGTEEVRATNTSIPRGPGESTFRESPREVLGSDGDAAAGIELSCAAKRKVRSSGPTFDLPPAPIGWQPADGPLHDLHSFDPQMRWGSFALTLHLLREYVDSDKGRPLRTQTVRDHFPFCPHSRVSSKADADLNAQVFAVANRLAEKSSTCGWEQLSTEDINIMAALRRVSPATIGYSRGRKTASPFSVIPSLSVTAGSSTAARRRRDGGEQKRDLRNVRSLLQDLALLSPVPAATATASPIP